MLSPRLARGLSEMLSLHTNRPCRTVALALLAAMALRASGASAAEAPAAAPRDVVLVTFDALRQDHLSLFGYERNTSPTIDWLAQHGTALRDVVPAGLSTKTSLTSLLTSLEYRTHRVLEKNEHLPPNLLTIAEAFRKQGYATAGFVATPHLAAELGYGRGFDEYEDFSSAGKEFVRAATVRDRVLAYLDRPLPPGRRARFVYIHFLDPHPPWLEPSPWLTEKEPAKRLFSCVELPPPEKVASISAQKRTNLIAKYDGAILAGDQALGAVVEKLRAQNALDRTLIAVSADHGLELLDRYSASHGWNPFDEVARGFLVLYDGAKAWGPAPAIQARNVDVAPTLMARAGLAIPAEFQGLDVFARAAQVPPIAISQGNHCVAVRTLTHKLVWIDFPADLPFPAMLHRGFSLFDLRADPGEKRDVQAEEPETFAQLRQAFDGFQREVGAKTESSVDPKHQQGLSDEARQRLEALGYVE